MSPLSAERVLALVPQQRPMRFVDRIVEVDDDHIVGRYTWREEDRRGGEAASPWMPSHFVLEMAAQIGNVAWCIYHLESRIGAPALEKLVGVFTEVEGAAFGPILPGETVECLGEFGEDGYFRGSKLVSRVTARILGGPNDGREVFSGLISGMFVPREGPKEAA